MRSAVQQYGAHPKFTGNCAHKIINIKEIPWIYNQLLKMDKFANPKKKRHISGCNLSIFLGNTLSIYLSIYLSIASQLNLDSRVTVKDWGWGFTVEPGFQGHCGAPQSTYLPIYLSIYLPTYLSIYPSIYLSIYCFTVEPGFQGHCEGLRLGFHSWTWIPGSLWSSAIYLPTYLSIYLSTYLPTYLSIYLSVHLSIYLLLHSWTWIPGSLWRTEAGVSQLNLDSRVTVELRNLPTYLYIYLSIYLPTYLPIYLSIASQLNLDFRVTVKDWGWGFTVEPGFQGHCGAPQSTYLPIYLSIYLSTYLPIYLSVHLSIYLLLHSWTWIPGSLWRTEAGVSQLNLDSRVTVELRNLPTYLSIYLSIYLPTYLPIYLSIRPSIYLSIASQLNLDSRVTVKDWGWGFTVEPGFQGHCGAPQWNLESRVHSPE